MPREIEHFHAKIRILNSVQTFVEFEITEFTFWWGHCIIWIQKIINLLIKSFLFCLFQPDHQHHCHIKRLKMNVAPEPTSNGSYHPYQCQCFVIHIHSRCTRHNHQSSTSIISIAIVIASAWAYRLQQCWHD